MNLDLDAKSQTHHRSGQVWLPHAQVRLRHLCSLFRGSRGSRAHKVIMMSIRFDENAMFVARAFEELTGNVWCTGVG